jgi:PII-like signaling protein
MLASGPAKKVTIHLNADTSAAHDFLSAEILSFLFMQGVSGATVTRPDAGFGSHHRWHSTSGGIDTDRHRPLRIEFIESAATIEALLPRLEALLTDGVLEVQDTTIIKAVAASHTLDRPDTSS